MAEKPFLILPAPTRAERQNLPGGPQKITYPPPGRQVARVAPKFTELKQVFERETARLRATMAGAEPEKALVLETVGRIDDFNRAVARVDGLKWLLDWDSAPVDQDEDFYFAEEDQGGTLPTRVYLMMSNTRGLRELESLWKRYRANPKLPGFERGLAKWRDVFAQLRDLRTWSPRDRLAGAELGSLIEDRRHRGLKRAPLLIEVWFRPTEESRAKASLRLREAIMGAAGEVSEESIIPEIAYHALAASVPLEAVEAIVAEQDVAVVQSDDVMFVRPLGQALAGIPKPDDRESTGDAVAAPQRARGAPLVALLDGYPIENHRSLNGALTVDDPDDWAGICPVEDRVHGTAMSSLLVHGDLLKPGESIPVPIYVRPILCPDPKAWDSPRYERIPEDRIPVQLVFEAVTRMLQGQGDDAPSAPSVRIINLSVADPSRPLDQYPSPWARALDYLSWKYGVLFLVSAGNYFHDLEFDCEKADLPAILPHPSLVEEHALRAVHAASSDRRILCPSESVNAVTVGALHEDDSKPPIIAFVFDPYERRGLPSPYSASGHGFRRAVKPDVFFSGGRQFYREKMGTAHTKGTLSPISGFGPPGHKVAAASAPGKGLDHTWYMRGTSNATALVSRNAALAYSAITALQQEPGGERLTDVAKTLLAKAMLVNACNWGGAGDRIVSALGLGPEERRSTLARLLGYGALDPTRLQGCAEHRATVLGFGLLKDGAGDRYEIPLPASLSGKAEWRKLSATLAWFSPINPAHDRYRRALLWFSTHIDGGGQDLRSLLRVDRAEVDWQACRRGTVQHEIFTGSEAGAFTNADRLEFQVNCRAQAGRLAGEVPYAFVVTLEVAQGVGIPVYEELRTAIQAQTRVRARAGRSSR